MSKIGLGCFSRIRLLFFIFRIRSRVKFFELSIEEPRRAGHSAEVLSSAGSNCNTASEGVGYGNCTLSFGPTGAEYNDWKLSSSMFNITHELPPKDKPDAENPMIGFRVYGRNTDPFFEERLAMELEAVKMLRREMGRKNVENMIRFVRTPDMVKDVTEVLENDGPKGGKDRSLHPAKVSIPLC